MAFRNLLDRWTLLSTIIGTDIACRRQNSPNISRLKTAICKFYSNTYFDWRPSVDEHHIWQPSAPFRQSDIFITIFVVFSFTPLRLFPKVVSHSLIRSSPPRSKIAFKIILFHRMDATVIFSRLCTGGIEKQFPKMPQLLYCFRSPILELPSSPSL